MDGRFVPNLTFGHPLVKCLRKNLGSGPFFDLHMMVQEPSKWIEPIAEAGGNLYTFHLETLESESEVKSLCRKIREAGMAAGIGIKPGTSVEKLIPVAPEADVLLVMTVEPGFGGQKFMGDMMPKVAKLRALFPESRIEVDGGVGPANVEQCYQAGADMIVSGTAITGALNPAEVIQRLKSLRNSSL
ncbi:unnamed protein product [Cyprideis torosa]|uniref:ribulose-phosphate 3-epimerase n=1 Tax=Cyprideis torosa TaxID=163714 RepID=A0A7R8WBN1_9CRUS|nr:unnamed protein product [Cyprideis torosa]CAG0889771.1 unnamed protein product [Cyprideis torosa]